MKIYVPGKRTAEHETAHLKLDNMLKKQIFLAMKLTAILITFAFMQVSAAVYSQKINITAKQQPLEQVLKQIEQQSGYQVLYSSELIQQAKPVTVNVTNATLEDALQKCFDQQPLTYEVTDKTILVKSKPKEKPVEKKETPGPPTTDISGTVTDEIGVPLSGASVTIKGKGTGVVTDAKGRFLISGVTENTTLVFSYVGYTKQEILIGQQTTIAVKLKIAKNDLDQVVIQAYGQTTQRLNTGDIATVTAKEIERQPVMNPLEALFGKVPGLVVTQANGYASGNVNLEIRGRANINSIHSDPLVIVDGVPLSLNGTGNGNGSGNLLNTSDGNVVQSPAGSQSPLFTVNPQDIESITVLKDADATAIYGSRGANGVVIITTKKGKPGKIALDVNFYQGIQKITNHVPLLNTEQYIAMRKEALKNDGIVPNQGNAYDLLVWDTKRYTDYQKYFWGGMGKNTDVETSISGGDKQTTYRISGGYHRATSIFEYSGADQRGTLGLNLNTKSLNQRLNISFTANYGATQSNLKELNGNVTAAPDSPPIFDQAGNLNYAGWAPISDQFNYGSLLQPYIAKTNSLNSSLTVQYELLTGLTAAIQAGFNSSNESQNRSYPIVSMDPTTNPRGSAVFGTTNSKTTILEPQITYKHRISSGDLNVLLGGSIQSNNAGTIFNQGGGYTDDNLLQSIANAPVKNASDGYYQYKYSAIFGRINYNWKDEYVLNLSARRDGSSRFGPGRQFGNFGAVGAAWIFTEEQWFKDNLSFLSFGKLRGSYGLTGSDQIADYQFLTQWSAGVSFPYLGSPAYIPIQHANPLLQWQTNKKLEAAVNFGFLKDRLTFELAWYRDRVGNELLNYNLPIITGFGGVYANFPATVQNTGLELTLNAKLIDHKDFSWDFNFQTGRNRNILLSFPNIQNTPYATRLVVGQPLNITQVLHYTGVDPQTGKYTYFDKNKDGVISTDPGAAGDLYYTDLSIKLDGGFGTDLRYRQWSLNLSFNFRQQVLKSGVLGNFPGTINGNQSTAILDHWQKPGDQAKYAAFSTQSGYGNFLNSDGAYVDGSYVKLRNVSVSYDLPKTLLDKAGFKGCLIYFRAQNVFTLTKYDGIDPDVPGLASLPPAKTFVFGIQFKL